jgi:hypothetical protein
LQLEPGSRLALPLTPSQWTVDQCTIEGLVVIAELRPSWKSVPALSAEAGRIVANADVVAGPLSLALFDAPNLLDSTAPSAPTLLLAASSESASWKSRTVRIQSGAQSIAVATAARKSVLGRTLGQLGPSEPYLIDLSNSVEVELVDSSQWLVSCDGDALAAGMNMAVVGQEVIQFGDAVPTGPGRFRLQRLLRGRAGTEWGVDVHAVGENFLLLERDAVRAVALPIWAAGASVTASAEAGDPSCAGVIASNQALRPLSPVRLQAKRSADGGLTVGWTRRSRLGLAWIDGVDAPLGEAREQYQLSLAGSGAGIEMTATEPEISIAPADLETLGPGTVKVEVRQAGDWGLSAPAQCTINL